MIDDRVRRRNWDFAFLVVALSVGGIVTQSGKGFWLFIGLQALDG
jgi:hypothetical protein